MPARTTSRMQKRQGPYRKRQSPHRDSWLHDKCRSSLFKGAALSENCPTFSWEVNMLRINSLIGLTLLLSAPFAFAADDESTPCDNVDSDAQGYACAAYNKQTAERELQAACCFSIMASCWKIRHRRRSLIRPKTRALRLSCARCCKRRARRQPDWRRARVTG